jgi:Amt family ammonium transporter
VGGALGALLTGVFAAPALGGTGVYDYVTNAVNPDYSILGQVIAQAKGVGVTIVWSGVVSLIAYKLVDLTIGLRATDDRQREGLDTAEHGERAYT